MDFVEDTIAQQSYKKSAFLFVLFLLIRTFASE